MIEDEEHISVAKRVEEGVPEHSQESRMASYQSLRKKRMTLRRAKTSIKGEVRAEV
ncbi:MAG: hypothetical protein AAGJ80_05365 [Cyanobacteria bacterium J06553_1]